MGFVVGNLSLIPCLPLIGYVSGQAFWTSLSSGFLHLPQRIVRFEVKHF